MSGGSYEYKYRKIEELAEEICDGRGKPHSPAYAYGVTGYSPNFEDCPEFTNLTRTRMGAGIVRRRFLSQGLSSKIYLLRDGPCPGLNPYLEPDL